MKTRNPIKIGEIFTRLTVTEELPIRSSSRGKIFKCKCICGKETVVSGNSLRQKVTKSCGCLQVEHIKDMCKLSTKHGKTNTPEYSIWSIVKQRCLNPNSSGYVCYGGKGVTIHKDWVNSFEKFFEEVGPRPGAGYHLDRIDGSKGYEPGNCRWVTSAMNQQNKSNAPLIEINGESKILAEWLRVLNFPKHRYYARLRSGLSSSEALASQDLPSKGYGSRNKRQKKIQKLNKKISLISNLGIVNDEEFALRDLLIRLENLNTENPDSRIVCKTYNNLLNIVFINT